MVIKKIGKAKDGAGGGGLLESGGEEWVAKNLTRESWGNSRRLRSKELRCQAPGTQSIVPLDFIYTVQIPTKKVGFSRQWLGSIKPKVGALLSVICMWPHWSHIFGDGHTSNTNIKICQATGILQDVCNWFDSPSTLKNMPPPGLPNVSIFAPMCGVLLAFRKVSSILQNGSWKHNS